MTAREIEKTVSFEVKYLTPPSVNHLKRPCKYTGRDGARHMGFKLTKETKAFYEAVALFARGRSVTPATEAERRKARYRVESTVVLGPKARGDADNFGKAICDGLQYAGVIDTDAKVEQCVINVVRDDRENPHTYFLVERMA